MDTPPFSRPPVFAKASTGRPVRPDGSLRGLTESATAIGSSPPNFIDLPGDSHQLSFQGIPHLHYTIQRSIDNLSSWDPIATDEADADGMVEFSDPSPPEGNAFYRIAVP